MASATKQKWMQNETGFLVENYLRLTKKEISLHLGRSIHSVSQKLQGMYRSGLQRKKPQTGIRHSINETKLLGESQDAYYLMGFVAADMKDASFMSCCMVVTTN